MSMSDQGSILVVDDEPHVSEMLEEYFAELGYSVDVATTGDEALRLAVAKRPDAVILDMRLPDMSGEQLLAKLRTLDGSLPIVMLSGYAASTGSAERSSRPLKPGVSIGPLTPSAWRDDRRRAVAVAMLPVWSARGFHRADHCDPRSADRDAPGLLSPPSRKTPKVLKYLPSERGRSPIVD